MRTKRTPDEWHNWYLAIERIAKELKEYYRASAPGEYHRNYSRFQKSSMKNSQKSKINSAVARAPLPAALDYRGTTRLFCRARPQRTGARLCLFRERAGARSAAKLLERDEARRIAVNIAKLPDLLRKPS